LWGEATKVGDQLFWCQENATLKVPVEVKGNTNQHFYLVSKRSKDSNLEAVPLDSDIFTSKVFCLHPPEVQKLCMSGNRTKELSPLGKLLAKYNIKIAL